MRSSIRYGLIAGFFLTFFILAPLIILFVTGIKYDFKKHAFIKTGILSIQTIPKKATVYLNGKAADATPTTLRFLSPGDYDVLVRKDGYFDWDKRLTINAQFVTFGSDASKNINLFFSKPHTSVLRDGVNDFFSGTKRILYLTNDTLYLADITSPDNVQQLKLPANQIVTNIIASSDENQYLLSGNNIISGSGFIEIFDATENKITDLSALINPSAALANAVQFSPDNNLYYLSGTMLYKIDSVEGKKTAVLQNVLSYLPDVNNIYYITTVPSAASAVNGVILNGSSENLDQARLPSFSSSVLLSGLPNWDNSKIYQSSQNHLFILGDGGLYTVGSKAVQVANFVKDAKILSAQGLVFYSTNNEIGFYDYLNGNGSNSRTQTITRSSFAIKNPVAFPDLGWVFYENDGRLQNIEIDSRDHQNNYTFSNISDNAQFSMDPSANNIFLLNNGILSDLQIR